MIFKEQFLAFKNNIKKFRKNIKEEYHVLYTLIKFSLIFILLLPIFFNAITFLDWSKIPLLSWIKVSESNQWVGFFASYAGGILGGIISGSITLLGVVMTINENRKKDEIESYAKKRYHADKVIDQLKHLNSIDNLLENIRYTDIHKIVTNTNPLFENILLDASKVNGPFYIEVLKLKDQFDQLKNFFDRQPTNMDRFDYLKENKGTFSEHCERVNNAYRDLDKIYVKFLRTNYHSHIKNS